MDSRVFSFFFISASIERACPKITAIYEVSTFPIDVIIVIFNEIYSLCEALGSQFWSP